MRLLLAVTLLLPALARAESDAYGSLVGMASAAATDKGPEAGELPKEEPSRSEKSASKTDEPAAEAPESDEPVAAPPPAPKKSSPAPARERKDDAESAVTVPAPQAPRIWTRLFASLLPPATRAAAFEIEASTVMPRALPVPPRPSTPASVAGSEQGLLEFVALATAPSVDER